MVADVVCGKVTELQRVMFSDILTQYVIRLTLDGMICQFSLTVFLSRFRVTHVQARGTDTGKMFNTFKRIKYILA